MNSKDIEQSTALICKHFDLEQSEFLPNSQKEHSFDELLKEFTRIISYLLDKDMPRLLNGLYRIDVDEYEFKKTIYESEADKVSESLALLIIKRELQKVELRKKYS